MTMPVYCNATRTINAQCEVIEARLNDLIGLERDLKIPGSLHLLYLCRIRDAVSTIKSANGE